MIRQNSRKKEKESFQASFHILNDRIQKFRP